MNNTANDSIRHELPMGHTTERRILSETEMARAERLTTVTTATFPPKIPTIAKSEIAAADGRLLRLAKLLDKMSALVGTPVTLEVHGNTGIYTPVTVLKNLDVYNNNSELCDTSFAIRAIDPQNSQPTIVTGFRVSYFPGCCAICVSNGTFVYPPYQKRGINHIGLAIREEIARLSGYTGILATDIERNEATHKTMTKAGWTVVQEVVNRRTRNNVRIYYKLLSQSL